MDLGNHLGRSGLPHLHSRRVHAVEVVERATSYFVALFAGALVHHPVIYELWAGPIRLNTLYPPTMDGQTQALKDPTTVGLLASITVALVVYEIVAPWLRALREQEREADAGAD